MNKRQGGAIALTVALLGGLLLWNLWGGPRVASAVCDVKSLRTYAAEAKARKDEAQARYLLQEARACSNEAQTTPGDGGLAGPTATPSPSTSPSAKPVSAKPAVRKVEYLANRPVAQKMGKVNNFGPEASLVYKGKKTAQLNAAQGNVELMHRIKLDGMLTAATGASLYANDTKRQCAGLWPQGQEDERTKLFAKNHREWDKGIAAIQACLAKSKLSVQKFQPGKYSANYALPGHPPLVRQDANVTRSTAFTALVVKLPGGTAAKLRLECGFQEYTQDRKMSVKALPKPSKGLERDEEGVPRKKPPATPEKPTTTPTPSKPTKTQPTTTPSTPTTSTPSTPTTTTPSETPTTTPTKPTTTPTPTPTRTPGKDPSQDPQEQGNNKPGGGGKEEGGSDEGNTDQPGTTPGPTVPSPAPPTKTTQPRPSTPPAPDKPEPTATFDPCKPVTPACG